MGTRVALLVAGVVVGLAAILTGGAVRDGAVAEATSATHTVATVLGAPSGPDTDPGAVLVPAVWTAPDGTDRTGTVAVAAGTGVGRTVDLWVDADGVPVTPLGLGAARTAGLLAGGLVLVGGGLPLAGVWWLVGRRRLDREWAAVEPQWSGLR